MDNKKPAFESIPIENAKVPDYAHKRKKFIESIEYEENKFLRNRTTIIYDKYFRINLILDITATNSGMVENFKNSKIEILFCVDEKSLNIVEYNKRNEVTFDLYSMSFKPKSDPFNQLGDIFTQTFSTEQTNKFCIFKYLPAILERVLSGAKLEYFEKTKPVEMKEDNLLPMKETKYKYLKNKYKYKYLSLKQQIQK